MSSFRRLVYMYIPINTHVFFYARLQYLCECHKIRPSSVWRGHNNIYFHFLNFRVFLFAQEVPFKVCHQLGDPGSNGFSSCTSKTCITRKLSKLGKLKQQLVKYQGRSS